MPTLFFQDLDELPRDFEPRNGQSSDYYVPTEWAIRVTRGNKPTGPLPEKYESEEKKANRRRRESKGKKADESEGDYLLEEEL